MTDLHTLLGNIQRDLNAPKTRYNKFGNFHYRNCEDIVEAVKKIMPAGCHITLSDFIEAVGDRIYVKAIATFSYGVESFSTQAYARESSEKKGMDSAMCTGTSSSYARKYALNGLFAIDDSKDLDEEDNHVKPFPAKKPESSKPQSSHGKSQGYSSQATQTTSSGSNALLISIDQEVQIGDLIRDSGADRKAFFEHYGISNLSQLKQDQYDKALRQLTKKMADNLMDDKSKYLGV